jgi:hypothetical protein
MFDTIKGIIGDMAAGQIKDQRIALSHEQLSALDAKLSDALSENERLSRRVIELERLVAERDAEITQLQPSTDLDPIFAIEILRFFFNESRDLSTSEVATRFSMPIGVAQSHTDTLLERGLIQQTVIGAFTDFGKSPAMFDITAAGRKYVMQHR